jgi:hypothetical protein
MINFVCKLLNHQIGFQVKKEAFENRFKDHQIYEGNPEVQEWLSRMTFDKKG